MNFKATVVANQEVSPGYYRLRLTAPQSFIDNAVPGQFVMVRVNPFIDPLLRRPFGIFDLGVMATEYPDVTQPFLEILYRVVGKGTATMATFHHGDQLDVLGPLGKGFVSRNTDAEMLLVGGGVGLAPLYYLAKELVKKTKVHLFAGGRGRDDVLCITEFERLGVETYVSTDDGSLGEQGLVTDVLGRYLTRNDKPKTIFACGPFPMLRAVAEIATKAGITCQVSLEAYMACGVGACLGCVIKGRNHTDVTPDYRCVCKDGPVFDHSELLWEQRL
jgi:dihydroorotate dehydrogenase electron transfer subunit